MTSMINNIPTTFITPYLTIEERRLLFRLCKSTFRRMNLARHGRELELFGDQPLPLAKYNTPDKTSCRLPDELVQNESLYAFYKACMCQLCPNRDMRLHSVRVFGIKTHWMVRQRIERILVSASHYGLVVSYLMQSADKYGTVKLSTPDDVDMFKEMFDMCPRANLTLTLDIDTSSVHHVMDLLVRFYEIVIHPPPSRGWSLSLWSSRRRFWTEIEQLAHLFPWRDSSSPTTVHYPRVPDVAASM